MTITTHHPIARPIHQDGSFALSNAPGIMMPSPHADHINPTAPIILLIEDDDLLADSLAELLRLEGFNAMVARTGQAGLDAVRSQAVACILLDLSLPDIPGSAVITQLKSLPDTQSIPIVVFSGDNSPATRAAIVAQGVTAYHVKPFTLAQLLNVIREVLGE